MYDESLDDENLLLQAAENVDRYIEETKPRQDHLDCLNNEFGHNQFRPKQWDIIRSIIEDKRDNCVVMPTGYGKSLCFQFPSVFTNGITIVVSPLISLMQDQVFALSMANIPACFLGSAQTDRTIEERIKAGEFRLVYASPEYLNGILGRELIREMSNRLTLIAIDEAHCVSHWGHDFRTDYRKLGYIRTIVPDVPILAVTATATPAVRDDICRQLKMQNPQVLCMGFDRSNIEFQVFAKSDDTWSDLKPFVTKAKGSIIIYVIKKATAEEIASILKKHGVKCEFYHATVTLKNRKAILEQFTKDQLQIIVATVAFGMGIDKPDVRYVIHYGPSKNLETYYQEVGRAGRDGFPSKAITFYKSADFTLIEWLLSQNLELKSNQVVDHLKDIAQYMREYVTTKKCRRKFILEYFQSETSTIFSRIDCCDNCRSGNSNIRYDEVYEGVTADGKYDFTDDAMLLLQATKLTKSANLASLLLYGKGEKKIDSYKKNELFGKGKLKNKNYWPTLVQQLKTDRLLEIVKLPPPYHNKLCIAANGTDWLERMPKERLMLKPINEMHEFFRKKKGAIMNKNLNTLQIKSTTNLLEATINDKELEHVLLSVRTQLALDTDCTPFLVASNSAIQEMVKTKPMTIYEFKEAIIDGFSIAKISKFASQFVQAIKKFQENEFSMENILQKFPFRKTKSNDFKDKREILIKSLRSKKTLKDLQAALNATSEQVLLLFIASIQSGLHIIYDHLNNIYGIDDSCFDFIKTNIEPIDTVDNFTNVKRKCLEKSQVPDEMFALVVTFVRVRDHLNALNVPYYDPAEQKLIGTYLLFKHCISKPSQPCTSTATSLAAPSTLLSSHKNINNGYFEDDDGYDQCLGDLCDEHFGTSSTTNDENKINLADFESKKSTMLPKAVINEPIARNLETNSNNALNEQITSAGSAVSKLTVSKMVNIIPKSKVVYCSESDSDSEHDNTDPKPVERKLPGWLSKNSSTSNQSSAIKKRKIF